ncbi:MAG: hypothetical protein A3A94_02485 [Candidatus Portnoybacteria bacterium RIFCSPLOWO2_01_FULL_43_11]|uniref:VanZ-like domain-containing protein n=4 Tax=Candidatus Portnoyibacteriota TaxID=1817913 RepID=A0A1G2FCP5_9BACT|nr:MAG: hypothetical protein A2815_02360 [Candidatus Portnoybacteria bacterium RIFCSPHIGHO2_01_FULL_40_12b]OGZ38876.1 MAG: hypothetical protein A3A94_02485 [Candidatus Portnoybacteria bacterium RIFCSPLOWO2_01_FULL_43_11]OGZ39463.1 MAG: hypothetical protein A3E90_01715 [Candidatus Portnoybacteria bacterium RIFCSPHIGHO2_12_FULL_40_11]OGZ40510.1 MAG: hypothetical protein A3I20_00475 [Candidatus Portnoybacteria bacterium RIFCSPLOWO2_02_FULL_40_15]
MKNWLLVFLWLGFISFLSHQPDLKSDLPGAWDFIFRKLAHFFEFAILAWLFFRAPYRNKFGTRQALNQNNNRALIAAIIFSVLFAFFDEWHQGFISGRVPSLKDVGIDSLGVFLSAWLIKKKVIK